MCLSNRKYVQWVLETYLNYLTHPRVTHMYKHLCVQQNKNQLFFFPPQDGSKKLNKRSTYCVLIL